MTFKPVKGLSSLNRKLSQNSWETYKQFLYRTVVGLSDVHSFKASIIGALRNDNVDALLDIADSLSSTLHEDATNHFVANQVAYLIKKFPFPTKLGSFRPEQVAREKFLESESACRRVNEYFRSVHDLDAPVQDLFLKMRGFISRTLGNFPSLDSWYRVCDFGPGANIGVSGKATNVLRKIAAHWTVTPGAFMYGQAAFSQDWNLLRCLSAPRGVNSIINLDIAVIRDAWKENCEVLNHNKIAFAPKTTRTARTIAVEPLINSYLQKGVDNLMRVRLKRIGIDLSDQETNSYMAYLGSIWDDERSFTTIDLSSASDSISIELCRNLLPPDWFDKLNAIRSQEFLLDGQTRSYEKFCSMGNGFCFPLETLIFTAAAYAIGCRNPGRHFTVYGDDIVVRKAYAHDLIALLEVMGFRVNKEKTFLQGPFRESCGKDFFQGKDVRPFVLDFAFDSVESIFKFLNLSQRSELTKFFFSDVRDFIQSLLPSAFQFVRPYSGPADTGITVEMDVFLSSPFARWLKGLQTWSWKELHHVPKRDSFETSRGAYALTLAAIRGATSDMPFTLRRETRATVRRVPVGTS